MRSDSGLRSARQLLISECAFDERRVDIEVNEVRVVEHLSREWQSRCDSFNHELTQATSHTLNRFFACWLVNDQLADHRVVIRADRVAFVNM